MCLACVCTQTEHALHNATLSLTPLFATQVTFGEDGFGVYRHMQKKNTILREDGYALASIVLEDLICEKCYNIGEVYCQTVESVSEGKEDEERWLPEHRRERMHALRPKILMGEMCVSLSLIRSTHIATMCLSLSL